MGQAAVAIPEKMYFKIGEVCELVGVQAHVLRYWETEFPQLAPQKNRSGQRSYRRRDVEISLRIKELLYDEMYTIAGARKKLQSELKEPPKLKIVHPEPKTDGDRTESPLLFETAPGLSAETLAAGLNEEQKQALQTISRNLMEIREILSRKLD
jgi:DNA-binding transcriptional MerR regulator